jgi:hypothetical protein
MKHSSQIKKTIALVAWMLALLPHHGAQAQHSATMYFMRDLPAVNMLNPAFQPEAGSIYVGIPLISSLYFDGGVTLKGMNLDNLMSSSPRLTSSAGNPSPYEGGYANVDVNLLNIGVLVRDMYFTLDITEKTRAEVAAPANLINLMWRGNAPYVGQAVSISGVGGRVSSYAEIALGFSKDVIPNRLTVGGRVKRLLGMGFADADLGKAAFLRTNNDWTIDVNVNPEFNTVGLIDAMPDNISSYTFAGKGWGVDVGFEIKNELLTVSGSILDVGAIRWRNANHRVLEKGNFDMTFRGVQLGGENTNINTVLDTLKTANYVSTDEDILRWTTSTATVGVAYPLNKHLVAGALAGIAVGQYNSYPLFALSLNTQKYPINGSLSYSYGHSHNLGLGMIFGRRGTQLHVICDNLFAVSYQTAQKINLRVGLNLLLGAARQTGSKKKTWSPFNTINSPANPYKDGEKPQPLNVLPSTTSKPATDKQPLNALPSTTSKPATDKQPLNPLNTNVKPKSNVKPLNPTGGK